MRALEAINQINNTAALYANGTVKQQYGIDEEVFDAAPWSGLEGTDPFKIRLIKEVNLEADQVTEIIQEAIRYAILQHNRDFVGVMVGYAQQGHNFFDHWTELDAD